MSLRGIKTGTEGLRNLLQGGNVRWKPRVAMIPSRSTSGSLRNARRFEFGGMDTCDKSLSERGISYVPQTEG